MTLQPCGSCPYRKDVPSGVWAESEYDKLPSYDVKGNLEAAFFCHQQTGELCAGWVGCHDMSDSIGLRLAFVAALITEEQYQEALEYQSRLPLWESGQAARDHGVAEILEPGDKAKQVVKKLDSKLDGLTYG